MERGTTQEPVRPLKIAFFIEGMYTSGVDTLTQLLAKALRQLGHRVVLFVPWKEHLSSDSAEDVFLLPALRVDPGHPVYLSYPISLPLIAEFKRQKFDIVHIHASTSVNLLAWQVAKLFDIPIVYTYHTMTKEYVHYWGRITGSLEPLVDSAMKLFDKMVCNGADIVLTPSAKAADYLAQIGISSPLTIVPNGIDLQSFHPHPSDFLQSRFGVPQAAKVLLFVGRLNQEKRPLLAYEIFRALSCQHNDLYLVMVGDGAIREELEQLALSDGLQGRLFLTGLVDYADMHSVYNAADIWISTSTSEVHPMVALEAVACGLPAVAWQDRALEGVIEHGVNGFIVETKEAFINGVHQLLEDEKLLHSMQSAAVRKIQAYSIEATAKQTLQLYTELIGHRSQNA
jgi:glycosyltransferase involved in cell wall biosynthesis